MTKPIQDVLSEIIGVPCGNVKLTIELRSNSFWEYDEYLHGRVEYRLEFNTLKPVFEHQIGSIRLVSRNDNKYSAVLLRGEETARITQAIAEMCKVN